MYSDILLKCKLKQNIQRLVYWNRDEGEDVIFGFPIFYNQSCIPMNFDPWSGEWIKESYISCCVSNGHTSCNINNIQSLDDIVWLNDKFMKDRKLHSYGRYCTNLESCTRYGQRGDSTIIEIPNIRAVGVLNKQEYGGWDDDKIELFFERNGYQGIEEWEFSGWTSMDYCPFCGAKLPDTLCKKLIEVLKDECELESWEDYKKAPTEFHSDEWWRKRGV